jgi:hypothetical protein
LGGMSGQPPDDEATRRPRRQLRYVTKASVTVVVAHPLGNGHGGDETGVREPRRPIPPNDHDTAEVPLPE